MIDTDHLHPTVMRPRVFAMLDDPEAKALGITLVSAFRSPDYQNVLYLDAVKRYGSAQSAGKWVAPPWHSDHGPVLAEDGHRVPYGPNQGGVWGGAVDIAVAGYQAVNGKWPPEIEQRVSALAAKYGLFSPMTWEDWHLEPDPNWTPPAASAAPQEETVQYAIVHATPAGVVATFKGLDGTTDVPVDPKHFTGIKSRTPARYADGIDGNSIVVYADPAADIVVTFT